MKKQKITRTEMWRECGINFHTYGATGHTLNNNPNSNNRIMNNSETEMLLPTGFSVQTNGQIETPIERGKRLLAEERQKAKKPAVDTGEEMLLPAGVELEA